MYNKNCDVWLANVRGNRYGLKHKTCNWTDIKFWNFCWTEIGKYDITAIIDYILTKINQKSIYYIGHSQGTTAYTVAVTERPEYNKKIKCAVFFSPVIFMQWTRSFFLKVMSLFSSEFTVSNIFNFL